MHYLTCGKRESVSQQHSMKNRRSVGAEPYARKKNEGNNRGGEGKDDTCDHGLHVQKLESRSVPKKKKNLEEMINQQSAAIRSTSSTKQHKLICQLRTNTRPLALDRQTTTATESGTTATTKHAILLPTYHHLRVAQLINRRNFNPRGPGDAATRNAACCVAFPGAVIVITTTPSSFSHACGSFSS